MAFPYTVNLAIIVHLLILSSDTEATTAVGEPCGVGLFASSEEEARWRRFVAAWKEVLDSRDGGNPAWPAQAHAEALVNSRVSFAKAVPSEETARFSLAGQVPLTETPEVRLPEATEDFVQDLIAGKLPPVPSKEIAKPMNVTISEDVRLVNVWPNFFLPPPMWVQVRRHQAQVLRRIPRRPVRVVAAAAKDTMECVLMLISSFIILPLILYRLTTNNF